VPDIVGKVRYEVEVGKDVEIHLMGLLDPVDGRLGQRSYKRMVCGYGYDYSWLFLLKEVFNPKPYCDERL